MTAISALVLVLLLLTATTCAGLAWQRLRGRLRTARNTDRVDAAALGIELGEHATLLQFSTRLCVHCRPASVKLSRLADEHPGVLHHEIDLSDDLATAHRYQIMQMPTLLVLDPAGRTLLRSGGPPRMHELAAFLTALPNRRRLSSPREKRAHA